jgi:putative effector of murein hydrolase
MGIAAQLGGIPALAAVFAVLTGLVGAISGKYLFDAAAHRRPHGARLCAGHGLPRHRRRARHAGAPRRRRLRRLALGLQVVLAALLMPLLASWLA